MLGLHFENCNKFALAMNFENCNLSNSCFYETKLQNTIFINVKFHEVDLVCSDFSGSTFENCDFKYSIFDNTIIEKADFRTSFNFYIDPDKNRIKKAKFSLNGVMGLLEKYDIVIE